MSDQLSIFDLRPADICAQRHGDSPTSVEAFNSTPESVRQTQRREVYAFVANRGAQGATTEVVSQVLGIPYTAASARMSELKKLGALVDSGERRKTSHGKNAAVLRANK